MHITAPLLLKAQFSDIVEFSSATEGWDLDFRQLDAGPLVAELEVVAGTDMVVQRVCFNRRIHQQGRPPKGILTFGLPADLWVINWHGRHLDNDYSLINFNRRNGFDAVSEDDFSAETLSITEEAFQRAVAILGVDIHAQQIPDCSDNFGIDKKDCDRIRQTSANFFELLRSGSTVTDFVSSKLQDELALAIVAAISESVSSSHELSYSKRQQAVNRALEIINSTNLVLSVSDLFENSACSWRTLDRGFQERFGITPKKYILATRMASVRRDIQASPPEARITDIANNWGFWHLGRFSIEYKRQFGESPSITARR